MQEGEALLHLLVLVGGLLERGLLLEEEKGFGVELVDFAGEGGLDSFGYVLDFLVGQSAEECR